jgi:hypothetical protein
VIHLWSIIDAAVFKPEFVREDRYYRRAY